MDATTIFNILNLLISIFTLCIESMVAIGTLIALFFAFYQIRESRIQATTTFEDGLNREYREIIYHIPTRALLGEILDETEYQKAFPDLFRYIDLSNQQVFMRQKGRIQDNTWEYWRDGIATNLNRYPFNQAWSEIKEKSQPSFSELKYLEKSDFKEDPKKWPRSESV